MALAIIVTRVYRTFSHEIGLSLEVYVALRTSYYGLGSSWGLSAVTSWAEGTGKCIYNSNLCTYSKARIKFNSHIADRSMSAITSEPRSHGRQGVVN